MVVMLFRVNQRLVYSFLYEDILSPEELRKQFQLFWVIEFWWIGLLCQEAEKFTFLTVSMLLILVYSYSMAFHE